jgi:hypothetical protein
VKISGEFGVTAWLNSALTCRKQANFHFFSNNYSDYYYMLIIRFYISIIVIIRFYICIIFVLLCHIKFYISIIVIIIRFYISIIIIFVLLCHIKFYIKFDS